MSLKPESRWLITIAKEENRAELQTLRQVVETIEKIAPSRYCPVCGTTPCMLPKEPA